MNTQSLLLNGTVLSALILTFLSWNADAREPAKTLPQTPASVGLFGQMADGVENDEKALSDMVEQLQKNEDALKAQLTPDQRAEVDRIAIQLKAQQKKGHSENVRAPASAH